MSEENQDRVIGRIEGKLDRLIADQEKAASARKQTYEKIEALVRKADETDRDVRTLDGRVTAMEGPVAEFSRWRERGIGAVMLISFVAASVGGLIAAFGRKVWSAVSG